MKIYSLVTCLIISSIASDMNAMRKKLQLKREKGIIYKEKENFYKKIFDGFKRQNILQEVLPKKNNALQHALPKENNKSKSRQVLPKKQNKLQQPSPENTRSEELENFFSEYIKLTETEFAIYDYPEIPLSLLLYINEKKIVNILFGKDNDDYNVIKKIMEINASLSLLASNIQALNTTNTKIFNLIKEEFRVSMDRSQQECEKVLQSLENNIVIFPPQNNMNELNLDIKQLNPELKIDYEHDKLTYQN